MCNPHTSAADQHKIVYQTSPRTNVQSLSQQYFEEESIVQPNIPGTWTCSCSGMGSWQEHGFRLVEMTCCCPLLACSESRSRISFELFLSIPVDGEAPNHFHFCYPWCSVPRPCLAVSPCRGGFSRDALLGFPAAPWARGWESDFPLPEQTCGTKAGSARGCGAEVPFGLLPACH